MPILTFFDIHTNSIYSKDLLSVLELKVQGSGLLFFRRGAKRLTVSLWDSNCIIMIQLFYYFNFTIKENHYILHSLFAGGRLLVKQYLNESILDKNYSYYNLTIDYC